MTIAVYGASGFTGRLVLAELAQRNIDVVLVGRDAGRLRSVAPLAGPSAEILVAGLDDPDVLTAAFEGTDVVINCAGPFSRYGEPVVRAAIAAGAHYVDITGEQLYVKQVFDRYSEAAGKAGVAVMPMVNDGGFLADLIAHLTVRETGPVDDLRLVHRMSGDGGFTRGSARTGLEGRQAFVDAGLTFEDGEWRAPGTPERIMLTLPDGQEPLVLETSPMPEVVTVPRHVEAARVSSYLEADVRARLAALTPELVERFPEDGPDETMRKAGRFVLLAEAVRDGRIAGRGIVRGRDPYGTTAVVAVEAALRLAQGAAGAGVLAPAQAFDAAGFLDALKPHEVTWEVNLESPA